MRYCEPDVWWGLGGIDALVWADGVPYPHTETDCLGTGI